MNDQERMTDLLLTETKMSSNYTIFASECVNNQLRSDFLNMLNEGQQMQAKLFQDAQSRGWYQTMPADQNQINQAYQKFSAMKQ